jgi:hypothetical protein
MRYVLINTGSGYICGDVHAETPIAAVQAIDDGRAQRDYRETNNHWESVYNVYTVPETFPPITDGFSYHQIESTIKNGILVACICHGSAKQ